MKTFRILLALATFFSAGSSYALTPVDDSNDRTVFKEQYEVASLDIVKPTVVSVTLNAVTNYGIAILENETKQFQPYVQTGLLDGFALSADSTSALMGDPTHLFDGDYRTSAEFDLDQDKGYAVIEFSANMEAEATGLSLTRDDQVALPHEIAISAWMNDGWKTIVAKTKINEFWGGFPNTTALKWRVEFWHAQPLRLKEMDLVLREESFEAGITFKWLARPGMTYTIYANAQADPNIQTTEAGNLGEPELTLGDVVSLDPNPLFVEPDTDGDTVPDDRDNCVSIPNTDQADIDDNGAGDACEDFDADGIKNTTDNCPDHPNAIQTDEDGDGLGDACDSEESRLTEKNKWLPWGVMGITALILLGVVGRTVRRK